jgi:hypothetical protein
MVILNSTCDPASRILNSAFRLLAALCFLAFGGCGSPPEPSPAPLWGLLRVEGRSSLPIDSVIVSLDDLLQGSFANPCTLNGVLAGTHKLTVLDSAGARTDTMVAIRQDELVSAVVRLTSVGPYLGNEAPNFIARDIDARNFELAAHRGKVVFLSFFEYT